MSERELLKEHDQLFVTFAMSLDAAQWQRQSLCSDWNAHQVLAHLVVGYSLPLRSLNTAMMAHRGNFNRANAVIAQRLATRQAPHQLIERFARLIDQPQGIGKVFPSRLLLGDHVLHHLDIALALGHRPSLPANVVNAVLDTEVRIPNPFVPAKRNATGFALYASDTGWHFGTRRGLYVEGDAIHLAAALAGRPRALATLRGNGVAILRNRIMA